MIIPIEEVLWDYQLIDAGSSAEEYEVMLFAVRKEIIYNFIENLNAVGIFPSGIQIASLAIYNFIKFEHPDMQTGVAIDIGAENTDLIITGFQRGYKKYQATQNYGAISQELKILQFIGGDRIIWAKVFNAINQTYMAASKDIAEQGQPKIWWKNFASNQYESGNKTYLQCHLKVAFEGLKRGNGDQQENLNYLKRYLIFPLEKTGFLQQEDIKEEYREDLNDAKEHNHFADDNKPYYFATITFKAYLNPSSERAK